MKKNIAILFLLISIVELFSQNTKKENRIYHKAIFNLDTNEIKNGKYLEYAKEFSIEKFISYYLENGKIAITKEHGDLIIMPLYKNNDFTYFVKTNQQNLYDIIKVNSLDLNDLPIEDLDGNELRQKFDDIIIPEKDKIEVKRKLKLTSSSSHNSKFTYEYQKDTKDIIIKFHWKITSGFYPIINKTYVSKYDIKKKKFVEL